jgi:hypothetical protein
MPAKMRMMSLMCKPFMLWGFSIVTALLSLGCSGPEEGLYTGKIGNKHKVEVRVSPDGGATLNGYWKEELTGSHERGTLKGKDMDALVFEGPASKKFKLRFLYEEDANDLVIRAIQSRNFGPGARYTQTEEDSVFDPPPRLTLLSGK